MFSVNILFISALFVMILYKVCTADYSEPYSFPWHALGIIAPRARSIWSEKSSFVVLPYFHGLSLYNVPARILKAICVHFRFKNVLFEIAATETAGVFDVSAKFMGVNMEKVEMVFQVTIMGNV